MSTRWKSHLSDQRRHLVELMQHIGFGRIEGLTIRGGDPILVPLPIVIREVKFGGENGPGAGCGLQDFALKSQVIELLSEFERLGDGAIAILTVKHGLPFSMHLKTEVKMPGSR